MKDVIFIKRPDYIDPPGKPQMIAIKNGVSGYYKVFSGADPADLNGVEIPEEVNEAAIAGSMFGWDCRAAVPAVKYFQGCYVPSTPAELTSARIMR